MFEKSRNYVPAVLGIGNEPELRLLPPAVLVQLSS